MTRQVLFKGAPVTLAGRKIEVGMAASGFRVVSQNLEEVRLSDFKGKIKVVNSFPSLDTPVCDLQVKEFNKSSAGLSGDLVILGISKDLPFAQKRFCEAFEIKNVKVLSDYKTSSFGINYGLLIKELNLLARAALIIDKNDILRYAQIAEELTHPLNYEEILNKLGEVIGNPVLPAKEGLPSRCKPCEGEIAALPEETVKKLSEKYRGWELVEGRKLVKVFEFKDFIDCKYFLDIISVIAEEQGHHPTMTISYNKLRITLTTHAAKGLTENDFIMAGIIEMLM